MGRRKKAQKVVKKKVVRAVATVFKCLFCNHEKSVSCKLNLSSMIGELVCRICDAKFETQINTLTDPIDVFSEWLDEANELQEQEQRRIQEGLATRAQGFVGDGADYVPERPDDLGENDDADVVIDTAAGDVDGDGDGGGDEVDVNREDAVDDAADAPLSRDEGYVDADDFL
jgi:transcription elongation factor Elf1